MEQIYFYDPIFSPRESLFRIDEETPTVGFGTHSGRLMIWLG